MKIMIDDDDSDGMNDCDEDDNDSNDDDTSGKRDSDDGVVWRGWSKFDYPRTTMYNTIINGYKLHVNELFLG